MNTRGSNSRPIFRRSLARSFLTLAFLLRITVTLDVPWFGTLEKNFEKHSSLFLRASFFIFLSSARNAFQSAGSFVLNAVRYRYDRRFHLPVQLCSPKRPEPVRKIASVRHPWEFSAIPRQSIPLLHSSTLFAELRASRANGRTIRGPGFPLKSLAPLGKSRPPGVCNFVPELVSGVEVADYETRSGCRVSYPV